MSGADAAARRADRFASGSGRAAGRASLVAVCVTGLAVWSLTRPSPPQVVRWTVTPSGATALDIGASIPLAISPDGTRLAYVGAGGHADLRARVRSAPATAVAGRWASRTTPSSRPTGNGLVSSIDERAQEGCSHRWTARGGYADSATPSARAGVPTTPSSSPPTTLRQVCCGWRPLGVNPRC